MSAHKWQFAPRFRRRAFGWRSDTPIQRIKEALTEIKQFARKEPVLAGKNVSSPPLRRKQKSGLGLSGFGVT